MTLVDRYDVSERTRQSASHTVHPVVFESDNDATFCTSHDWSYHSSKLRRSLRLLQFESRHLRNICETLNDGLDICRKRVVILHVICRLISSKHLVVTVAHVRRHRCCALTVCPFTIRSSFDDRRCVCHSHMTFPICLQWSCTLRAWIIFCSIEIFKARHPRWWCCHFRVSDLVSDFLRCRWVQELRSLFIVKCRCWSKQMTQVMRDAATSTRISLSLSLFFAGCNDFHYDDEKMTSFMDTPDARSVALSTISKFSASFWSLSWRLEYSSLR